MTQLQPIIPTQFPRLVSVLFSVKCDLTNCLADTPSIETLCGLIYHVTFHSSETGYCVLKVHPKGLQNEVTVVGNISVVSVGENIEATGSWVHDKQYGQQFRAHTIKTSPPMSLDGIERYLSSGIIKGVGPAIAKKLIDAFGTDVLDVIENHTKRISKLPGIGSGRAENITRGWFKVKAIRDIMLFLHSHKVSTTRAARIFKVYGVDAIANITRDPYILARDIRGMGFPSADVIAMDLGIEKTSMLRARAGISYALTRALDEGHCGLPVDTCIAQAESLLDIPRDIVCRALDMELESKNVIKEIVENTTCIFLSHLCEAECSIAQKVKALTEGSVPWPKDINIAKALKKVNVKKGIVLSSTQIKAIETALKSKVTVITGGPGVGKTTLINSILGIVRNHSPGLGILLAAPTGRAARRMFDCTGMEAMTIHRLLGTDPITGEFEMNEKNPLTCDLLIIDEMSMVDVLLMKSVLRALPPTAALILVGDVDQLPSVGPGRVLGDMIQCQALPVIRLTTVFRQAVNSQIVEAAHSINEGTIPKCLQNKNNAEENPPESDFYFVEAESSADVLDTIIKMVKERIPLKFGLSPITDIQVLCPMSRGIVGTRNINIELQQHLNPSVGQSVLLRECKYSVGDKVMQTRNNYDKDVFNGDIGTISEISHKDSELKIKFDDMFVTYDFLECDEFVLAYATTIHKSQGSEYPAVVIPLTVEHTIMLQRNLLYTGVTRGKKLVVIIGQRKALAMAVRYKDESKRWTSLKQRLEEQFCSSEKDINQK